MSDIEETADLITLLNAKAIVEAYRAGKEEGQAERDRLREALHAGYILDADRACIRMADGTLMRMKDGRRERLIRKALQELSPMTRLITDRQFELMTVYEHNPHERMQDIADRWGVTVPAVHNVAKSLIANGLLVRNLTGIGYRPTAGWYAICDTERVGR